MSGLADSAVRIASTIHPEILDSSLQYRASAYGAGSRRPRSPVHRSRLPASKFAPSPRRIVRRPSQVDPWRTASPIFPRTCLCVTQFLRTTGIWRSLQVDSLSFVSTVLGNRGGPGLTSPCGLSLGNGGSQVGVTWCDHRVVIWQIPARPVLIWR